MGGQKYFLFLQPEKRECSLKKYLGENEKAECLQIF
jgi:hypothetical protein